MKRKKQILISLTISLFLFLFLILPFGISYFVYEDYFENRYEVYEPLSRNIDEFENLLSEKYTFTSNDGQELVGYKYFKNDVNNNGIVIISHGLGGGGHNFYMDVADYLTSNGYVVFAYDATANGESEGDAVNGLPQGIIDLDYAIQFIKNTDEFKNLPIMLFGHSWGAYSGGSVLNIHPDIKAVVSVAGFNKSTDMLELEGKKMIGAAMDLLLPYFTAYERFKFGKYSSYNCIDGYENSDANIMIIQSSDDEMIPIDLSFDMYYKKFNDDPSFKFVKLENRGHNYAYYSDNAKSYRTNFDSEFVSYLRASNLDITPEIKAQYLNETLDKTLLYDLDDELMKDIVEFYNNNIN